MSSALAWHFVGDTLRDGRPIPADNEVLRHDGDLILCESGLHASERAIDALVYSPGSTVCRVLCDEIANREYDKFVCSKRMILWRIDATETLRSFARMCALDVASLWDMPAILRKYLETGEESLRAAARDAAYASASAAAWDAACAAAWAADRDAPNAANASASAAATSAVWAAHWDADWDAVRDTIRDAQDKRLTKMLIAAAHGGA